jgi:hypothetical protein
VDSHAEKIDRQSATLLSRCLSARRDGIAEAASRLPSPFLRYLLSAYYPRESLECNSLREPANVATIQIETRRRFGETRFSGGPTLSGEQIHSFSLVKARYHSVSDHRVALDPRTAIKRVTTLVKLTSRYLAIINFY